MSVYAVIREAGPGWVEGRGVFGQSGVQEHAGFMNGLASEGVIHFAGPLAGSENGRIRVLLIMDAASDADIRRRLSDDPWSVAHLLVVKSVEPWNLMIGADRLSPSDASRRS